MNEDIAFGDEEGEVLLHLQLTHGLICLVTQDVGHHRLLDMVLSSGHHGYTDTVAVQGKHRVTLRHEDRLAPIVGQERVLAVSLADERTLLHLSLLVQAVLTFAHLRKVVVPAHLVECVNSQHLRRMCHQLQLAENLFQRKGLVRAGGEHSLQGVSHSALRQSLSSFILSHSSIFFRYKLLQR